MTNRPQAVPPGVEHNVPLARLTTVGIGGPALYFGRPEQLAELERLLLWAREASLAVFVVGLGSNVLAADSGVDGLVLRLSGELAAVQSTGHG